MKIVAATLPATKCIALVAHDNKKPELIAWATRHKKQLSQHQLCGTGTTAKKLSDAIGLPVAPFLSGPLGGDQQLGAQIAEGEIHCLIFFWDPFQPMPHDPDVKALLRLATAWNIPIASNTATADLIMGTTQFDETLERDIPDYDAYLAGR